MDALRFSECVNQASPVQTKLRHLAQVACRRPSSIVTLASIYDLQGGHSQGKRQLALALPGRNPERLSPSLTSLRRNRWEQPTSFMIPRPIPA